MLVPANKRVQLQVDALYKCHSASNIVCKGNKRLTVGTYLGDTHEGWDNAVYICTSVRQCLLLPGLSVECLQGLVKGLELESSLFLGKLQLCDT